MGGAGTFPLHTGLFQEMLRHALILSRIRAYTEGMTTNTTANFTLTVIVRDGIAERFEANAYFATIDDANAAAATLPAKLKAHAYKLWVAADEVSDRHAGIVVQADLRGKKGNDRNETGVARLALLLKSAKVEYVTLFSNSARTLDEAIAAAGMVK